MLKLVVDLNKGIGFMYGKKGGEGINKLHIEFSDCLVVPFSEKKIKEEDKFNTILTIEEYCRLEPGINKVYDSQFFFQHFHGKKIGPSKSNYSVYYDFSLLEWRYEILKDNRHYERMYDFEEVKLLVALLNKFAMNPPKSSDVIFQETEFDEDEFPF